MRKMMKYSRAYGGADPELVEGDVFRIVIRVPEFSERPEAATPGSRPDTQVTPEVAPEVAPEVTPEVERMLREISGTMTRGEIMRALKLKDEKHFRERYQQIAVFEGLIEMTIPEKPNSRLQRYRLTAKGQQWLKENRS